MTSAPASIFYGVDAQTAQGYGHLKAEILRRFGPQEKSKRRRTKIEHLGISDFQRLQEAQPFALENWLFPTG